MRTHCTDDEQEDIMDLSEALDLSAQHTEDDINQPQEKSIMATRKNAAAAAALAAAPAAAPTAETAATGGPRAIPEGHVGLAALAEKYGTTPAAMRRKLRSTEGFNKPEGQHGWYFKEGSADLKKVHEVFTAKPAEPAAPAQPAAPAAAAPAKKTKAK